jgi:hypothetical protein
MAQRNINIGKISKNKGTVTINTGDTTERPLTPAEANALAFKLEKQLLAKRIQEFRENLHNLRNTHNSGEPYKDLFEYTLADADIFFGREEAQKTVLQSLKSRRFIVLQSESGAGKTSLLQAGILPQLIREDVYPIYLRRPYDRTPAEALKQIFFRDPAQAPILSSLRLNAFLYEMCEIIGKTTSVMVLVDQFEEFFRVVDATARQVFIKELAECLNDLELNVHWLLAMRTDAMGQLGQFQPDIPDPFEKSYYLKRLTSTETEQIIVTPAHKMGIDFEPGLVQQMISDLGGENIAPPEVQLVCATLKNRLTDQTTITRTVYDAAGGVNGILSGHLAHAFKELTIPEQEIARLVLEALVTSTRHRSMRTEKYLLGEFQSRKVEREKLHAILGKLTRQHLIRSGEADMEPTYELAHDYLLDKIDLRPETKHFKEAQEILEQGVRGWEKYGVILDPKGLEIIEKRVSPDVLTNIQAKLLLLSAIEYGRPAEKWGQRLDPSDLETLQSHFGRNRRKNRAVQWAMRSKLPWPRRAALTFWQYATQGSSYGMQILKTVLLVLFIGLVAGIGIMLTGKSVTSEHVQSFNSSCINANPSENLMVAVDASNPSHVVAFDPTQNILCESGDSAATWRRIDFNAGQRIRTLAVDRIIYLAGADQILWLAPDKKWHQTAPLALGAPITHIGLDSAAARIFVSLESDQMWVKDTVELESASGWEPVHLAGINGHIQGIAVNYQYLAVNTSSGVWYTKKSALNWQKFQPLGNREIVFKSLALTYPLKGFYGAFNASSVDKFAALQEGGQLFFGYLTDENSLTPLKVFAGAKSLALNGTSIFLTNETGLACDQVWDITDWEWWLIAFSANKPCSQQ